MSIRSVNRKLGKQGQITVFLALVFLVMSTAFFMILDGMRLYLGRAEASEALYGAGQEVSANYDREAFRRYHLFMLDPRENAYIEQDGMQYINAYLKQEDQNSICVTDLMVDDERFVLDQEGRYLRTQMAERMKLHMVSNLKSTLQEMLFGYEDVCAEKEVCQEEISEAEVQEELVSDSPDPEVAEPVQGETGEQKQSVTELIEGVKEILSAGVLSYAADGRSISEKTGQGGSADKTDPELEQDMIQSLKNLTELNKVLNREEEAGGGLQAPDEMLCFIAYLDTYFNSWMEPDRQEDSVLVYEQEYLLGRADSDRDNLKTIVNRIFLIRFASNYVYACSDRQLCEKLEPFLAAAAGITGMPVLTESVKLLLIGTLAYAESLLDLHALLQGKKVPFFKSPDTWTVDFSDALIHLKEKTIVKEGTVSISYQDYLKLFLVWSYDSLKDCRKVAAVMEQNIRQEEEQFSMNQALAGFSWQGAFQCPMWYAAGSEQKAAFVLKGDAGYDEPE